MLIAQIGGRCHYIAEQGQPVPKGYVEVKEPNPSADYIAQEDGTWKLSYTREQAFHHRRIAYTSRLDPLISEYTTKMMLGDMSGAEKIKEMIKEQRIVIQSEYQYDDDLP